jgi:hypothetical protein
MASKPKKNNTAIILRQCCNFTSKKPPSCAGLRLIQHSTRGTRQSRACGDSNPGHIGAEATEWVCFNMVEPGELDAVRPYFRGVDRVAELPRGSFIAYNRENGGELAGKLF